MKPSKFELGTMYDSPSSSVHLRFSMTDPCRVLASVSTCRRFLRETLKMSNAEDLNRLTACSLVLLGHIFYVLGNHRVSPYLADAQARDLRSTTMEHGIFCPGIQGVESVGSWEFPSKMCMSSSQASELRDSCLLPCSCRLLSIPSVWNPWPRGTVSEP